MEPFAAAAMYNASTGGAVTRRHGERSTSNAAVPYCNVHVMYRHTGRDETIPLVSALSKRSEFKNHSHFSRGDFLLSTFATGGCSHGAASGPPSAAYDAFTEAFEKEMLYTCGYTGCAWGADKDLETNTMKFLRIRQHL